LHLPLIGEGKNILIYCPTGNPISLLPLDGGGKGGGDNVPAFPLTLPLSLKGRGEITFADTSRARRVFRMETI
jgi:hypothetical protein